MTFLPDFGIKKEVRKKKDLTNTEKTDFQKMQLLGMLTSRNFARLSIFTSALNRENFRSISQRLAILQKNL